MQPVSALVAIEVIAIVEGLGVLLCAIFRAGSIDIRKVATW